MTDEGNGIPAALRIARQVLNREGVPGADAHPPVVAAALKRVYDGVSATLRDALGEAGYDALLFRALTRTEPAHPALKDMFHRDGSGVQVEVFQANVEAHGAAAVTAGIEALFAAVIDILSRLIGEDMATRLIERDDPRSGPRNGAPAR